MTWATHNLHFNAVQIGEPFIVSPCLSVGMCARSFVLCALITHVYSFLCVSKVVNLSSGSLSTACWRAPYMVDGSTTPLTSASYAPTWSSSSLHASSRPPSQPVRERAEEERASFRLRSASRARAQCW